MNAKQELDQASLYLARAVACTGYNQPNNAKRNIKVAIDAMRAAYTKLDGNDPNYQERKPDGS